MKILYFANSRIPTEKAHGLQIMKTCEGLAVTMSARQGVTTPPSEGGETVGITTPNQSLTPPSEVTHPYPSLGGDSPQVSLIMPTRRNQQFLDIDLFEYYGVKKVFQVIKLKTLDPTWLMKLRQGIYIKVQTVFFLVSLFVFLIHKKNRQADFFYTRDEYLLPLLQLFSKKVVWEAHNLPRRRAQYLKFWQRCLKIIAISQGVKNELVKLGVDDGRILVAADGVELDNFKFQISNFKLREELNLPVDKKIVMYTGHLYDWKGADVLLAAARNFQFFRLRWIRPRGTIFNFQLMFVFVGGTAADVKRFKEEARGLDNVLIVGYRPPEEISHWLGSADILVLPNSAKKEISHRFTSPLKMFEYMAAGRPIVAADLPSIREVLNHDNAVLVEPDDPESLSRGIKDILTNQEKAKKIAGQAFSDAQHYSWQKRGEKIFDFLKIKFKCQNPNYKSNPKTKCLKLWI